MNNNDREESFVQYRNVLFRDSIIHKDAVLGDDSVVIKSEIMNNCLIERRAMVFESKIDLYSSIGFNSVIRNSSIGKFSSIAWNVSCGGAEHKYEAITSHIFPLDNKMGFTEHDRTSELYSKDTSIGNDVWIGANVCILRGVNVGDGAVIGAGAVVTKDVPSYEVWAGNPAKKIKDRFPLKIRNALNELQWWNIDLDKIKANIELFQGELTIDIIERIREI